jgi:hypothetical protein
LGPNLTTTKLLYFSGQIIGPESLNDVNGIAVAVEVYYRYDNYTRAFCLLTRFFYRYLINCFHSLKQHTTRLYSNILKMIRHSCLIITITLAVFASFGAAFVPRVHRVASASHLHASLQENLSTKVAATAAFIVANAPAVVLAIEDDGYEYGKVDAPIGFAWAAGVLVLGTAFLPVLMKGGEEAFDEMRDREKDTFGKNNDILGPKK